MSCIYVLAGVNGAGKSTIGGAAFRAFGGDYYNPDEAARKLIASNPALQQTEANSRAWRAGLAMLEQAIAGRLDFAFETTLGASTIPRVLAQAAAQGIEVRIWYAGLATAALHIARVRARVARGGHAIPEQAIRRRFEHSRLNLIQLMPVLTALRVYDNSVEADPAAGKAPTPQLLLHMERGRIMNPRDLPQAPDWAKPVVAAAMKLNLR
jgi:predicted ABC-type ATPase